MRGKYVVNKSVQNQQKKAMQISYQILLIFVCLNLNLFFFVVAAGVLCVTRFVELKFV